jgi:hypothetical protein
MSESPVPEPVRRWVVQRLAWERRLEALRVEQGWHAACAALPDLVAQTADQVSSTEAATSSSR